MVREEERRKACNALNKIEERLVSELLDAYEGGLPDFWDILNGLDLFLRVSKVICVE